MLHGLKKTNKKLIRSSNNFGDKSTTQQRYCNNKITHDTKQENQLYHQE